MPRLSKTMMTLQSAYNHLSLDIEDTVTQCRHLLANYKRLVWISHTSWQPLATTYTLSDTAAGLSLIHTLCQKNLPLLPSTNLASTDFVTHTLHQVLAHVRAYPHNGALFYEILHAYYFDDTSPSDEALMARLHLERSSYYQRKKEALSLFGYLLFAWYLPALSA